MVGFIHTVSIQSKLPRISLFRCFHVKGSSSVQSFLLKRSLLIALTYKPWCGAVPIMPHYSLSFAADLHFTCILRPAPFQCCFWLAVELEPYLLHHAVPFQVLDVNYSGNFGDAYRALSGPSCYTRDITRLRASRKNKEISRPPDFDSFRLCWQDVWVTISSQRKLTLCISSGVYLTHHLLFAQLSLYTSHYP